MVDVTDSALDKLREMKQQGDGNKEAFRIVFKGFG